MLDSGGYGRAAGGVGGLARAAALFVAPVKVGACVWIGGTMANRSLSVTRAKWFATSIVVPDALKYATSVLVIGVPFVAAV